MDQVTHLSNLIVEFYEKLSSWEHSVVRGADLTLPQVHAIEILGAGGAMPMKELAARTGVTTGTLTVLVDRLESRGFVERRPNETDRRSILVGLTPAGERAFDEHDRLHRRLSADLAAALDESELAVVLAALAKMNQAF